MYQHLTWNKGLKNQVDQIGRYTVKAVRIHGLDCFGVYLGAKLVATKLNFAHACTYSHKLMGRDSRDHGDILELLTRIERYRARMEQAIA
jgi:hypothetical protein